VPGDQISYLLREQRVRAVARAGAGASGPLFERLPRGPHQLERREVLLHQRARIHAAMVECVAREGYAATSVKGVITLAGVSRRAFYEQFANREDCFLATFDLIAARAARRVREACCDSGRDLQGELLAALAALAQMAAADRNASALVILHAPRAGRSALARARSLCDLGARELVRSFERCDGPAALAAPSARAVTGGLRAAAAERLSGVRAVCAEGLERALADWLLPFADPATGAAAERLAAGVTRALRAAPALVRRDRATAWDAQRSGQDERERLLHGALRLAALTDYTQLAPPQIADAAGVPVDAFCELFADPRECYLAALEEIVQQLLEIVSDDGLLAGDWPRALRRALGRLLAHLAANPLHARTLGESAFAAGAEAAAANLRGARAIAARLTAGAPAGAGGELAAAATAGAIWHTIGCQAVADRAGLLPVLGDHLAFVVLTPLIGASAAADALAAGQHARGGASGGACE